MRDPSLSSSESYAPLLIRATDQRRSKKLFGLRSTSARFQRKCFFPLSANLRKIHNLSCLSTNVHRHLFPSYGSIQHLFLSYNLSHFSKNIVSIIVSS